MTGTREAAIRRSLEFFDNGGFHDRLAELVAIRSTSQEPEHEPDCRHYLEHLGDWLKRMGFTFAIHENPRTGFGPILTAERVECPSYRNCLTYGHCVAVRSMKLFLTIHSRIRWSTGWSTV